MRKILKEGDWAIKNMLGKITHTLTRNADKWEEEGKLFTLVLKNLQTIMQQFLVKVQKNELNAILSHCTDFLQYCGHLIVAWRLWESAIIAQNQLENSNSNSNGNSLTTEQKEFYQSKIIDFKFFCKNFLVKNLSLFETISNFQLNLDGISV